MQLRWSVRLVAGEDVVEVARFGVLSDARAYRRVVGGSAAASREIERVIVADRRREAWSAIERAAESDPEAL